MVDLGVEENCILLSTSSPGPSQVESPPHTCSRFVSRPEEIPPAALVGAAECKVRPSADTGGSELSDEDMEADGASGYGI